MQTTNSEFDRALTSVRLALAAGAVRNYDVNKDNHGYRYISYESKDGGWNSWFDEGEEESAARHQDI